MSAAAYADSSAIQGNVSPDTRIRQARHNGTKGLSPESIFTATAPPRELPTITADRFCPPQT
jgi:hypothetical protein